ncbi:MAG TPA: hypothetical protein VMH28_07675 [Candidatus Acidoferrales bacterium]|nr:hypothetical protein [Candidatus Acidoferrales bacterium]
MTIVRWSMAAACSIMRGLAAGSMAAGARSAGIWRSAGAEISDWAGFPPVNCARLARAMSTAEPAWMNWVRAAATSASARSTPACAARTVSWAAATVRYASAAAAAISN